MKKLTWSLDEFYKIYLKVSQRFPQVSERSIFSSLCYPTVHMQTPRRSCFFRLIINLVDIIQYFLRLGTV